MSRSKLSVAGRLLFGLAVTVIPAFGDSIFQFTNGNLSNSGVLFGEKFTTSALNPAEDHVTVSFLTGTGLNVGGLTAPGVAFLFSQEYLGTPDGMTAATPGFLGQATGVAGVYSFDPTIVLQPDTAYYLYQSITAPANVYAGVLAGALAYYSTGHNSNYIAISNSSYNIAVTGTAVTTISGIVDSPEPGTLSLLGLSALALFLRRRR